MSTIVAIVASPRKEGNSSTLVKEMVVSAKQNGNEVKVHYLNTLSNVKGCQACMACKKTGKCVLKDDVAQILEDIRGADGIILSTPLYFSEANGQFRLLQDRFFSFLDGTMRSNLPPGKKVATVVTCGSGAPVANALADKLEGTMVNYFQCVSVGKIVAAGNAPDDASKNKAAMEEAAAIGKKF
jgi:multimeric flavodoxin WrbA